MTPSTAVERATWVAAGVAFLLVATANAGAYRFGVSDQAFYIPAVTRALDPSAFPRDAALVDAQSRLMLADEALALASRATGASLEVVFLGAYLLSIACLWWALVLIGRHISADRWTILAIGAAFSLRHRITLTSANSFEPYFHPRMLAFGVGLLAVAAVLRRRHLTAVALVLVASLVHLTTGAWFAILLGTAIVVMDATWRRIALPAGIAVAAVSTWVVLWGPLAGRLVVMDPLWLQAVSSKDSLFASDWPASAWLANLGLLGVLWGAHIWRRRQGHDHAEERALVWGATALVALFLVTLPAVVAALALPVQLQISRVFWLVDALAGIYLVAAVMGASRLRDGGRKAVAALIVGVAVARGVYIVTIEHPERPLFELRLPDTAWTDAMRWMRTQPREAFVLADAGHAWKYGSSVRVAAGRDVFLEETKDTAIAIYSRDVGVRVVERIGALGDFARLTTEDVQRLGERYGLTHVVTEGRLELPLLYENRQFRIYALSAPVRLATGPRARW